MYSDSLYSAQLTPFTPRSSRPSEDHAVALRDTRTEPLSRSEIAQVALAMVDRDGSDSFSMRSLAAELRVTTMAVYHHFESKAEVLQAAADQVWIEVVSSMQQVDDPVESFIQGFLVTRRVFHRHAEITPYAVASPTTEDALHLMATGVTHQLERVGLSGKEAGEAYFMLATFTLGSAALHAQRTILDRSIRAPVSDLAQLAPDLVGSDPSPTYLHVRDALGHDPELVRFERALRDLVALLLERWSDGLPSSAPTS
jgi:AcrR family transcriptional regulator